VYIDKHDNAILYKVSFVTSRCVLIILSGSIAKVLVDIYVDANHLISLIKAWHMNTYLHLVFIEHTHMCIYVHLSVVYVFRRLNLIVTYLL